MDPNFTGVPPLYTLEFDDIQGESGSFFGNSLSVANTFEEDLHQYNLDLDPFDFDFINFTPPSLSPTATEDPVVSTSSENLNTSISCLDPVDFTIGFNSLSLENSNPWASMSSPRELTMSLENSYPQPWMPSSVGHTLSSENLSMHSSMPSQVGPTMFLENSYVQASMPSPLGPSLSLDEMNKWASRSNRLESSLSLEKSNVQASGPSPVRPTKGSDRGKSVFKSRFKCGATGGILKKGKQRCKRNLSSTVMIEGKLITLLKKKTIDSEKLAELARVDPKTLKRILDNRKSAAASKERVRHRETELQEQFESLKTKITEERNNLRKIQENCEKIPAEMKEFRKHIDARRDNLRIRNAIGDARERELLSLKIETDHYDVVLRPHTAAELFPQFSSQLPLQQFHYPPIYQQHVAPPQQPQLHMTNPFPPTSQNFNEQYDLNFSHYFKPPN